jgi:hypothetical protein
MHKDFSVSVRRPRASSAERSRLVALYRSSLLTQMEFASEHDINVHTLRKWLRQDDASSRNQSRQANFDGARLREISLGSLFPAQWAAEVSLPSGASIRLHSSASGELVSHILTQLSRPC